MFEKYKDYMHCPECQSPLILEVFERESSWIISGLFSCQGGNHFYPIIDGIPRLLSAELLVAVANPIHLSDYLDLYSKYLPESFTEEVNSIYKVNTKHTRKARTANWYSFMWKKYNTDFDSYDKAEFQRLTGGMLDFSKYKGKSVADVGAGQGRFTMPLLESGAKEVVCMDLGEAISLASKKYRHDDRVLCVQTDIYKLPFERCFDLVICIGVLQHLPDPSGGFGQLTVLSRPGGRVFAWCYGESTMKPILIVLRSICKFMPVQILWWFSAIPAFVRFMISLIGIKVRRMKMLKMADQLPFSMYEGYSFNYMHTNTFDHLSARIINFFERKDIEKWMKAAKIKDFSLVERFPGTAAASWVIDLFKPDSQENQNV